MSDAKQIRILHISSGEDSNAELAEVAQGAFKTIGPALRAINAA